MTDYVFSNAETFKATVVLDDDDVMSEQVEEALAADLTEAELADKLAAILNQGLSLVGSGRGRHQLMELVQTTVFLGSIWRIRWDEVARHYLAEKAATV